MAPTHSGSPRKRGGGRASDRSPHPPSLPPEQATVEDSSRTRSRASGSVKKRRYKPSASLAPRGDTTTQVERRTSPRKTPFALAQDGMIETLRADERSAPESGKWTGGERRDKVAVPTRRNPQHRTSGTSKQGNLKTTYGDICAAWDVTTHCEVDRDLGVSDGLDSEPPDAVDNQTPPSGDSVHLDRVLQQSIPSTTALVHTTLVPLSRKRRSTLASLRQHDSHPQQAQQLKGGAALSVLSPQFTWIQYVPSSGGQSEKTSESVAAEMLLKLSGM